MITIDGTIQLTLEQARQVRERLAEMEAQRPEPIPGQVYRWHETTNKGPFVEGYLLFRFDRAGKWSCKTALSDWFVAQFYTSKIENDVRSGLRVPYTPPAPAPWVPKVGEWVVSDAPGSTNKGKALRVVECPSGYADYAGRVWRDHGKDGILHGPLSSMRPATPDEEAAAKRIEVKVGLILQAKGTARVWQYTGTLNGWVCLSGDLYSPSCYMGDLTTDRYEVLDSYIVRGAK